MADKGVQSLKIVVMGGGGVGKSALTIRLVTNKFMEVYDPTIEDSYCKQISVDGDPCLLDILDTAGQEEFSAMQDQWMREGQGFVLVYSIVDDDSFDAVQILREKVIRTKDRDPDFDPMSVPIVLCGNKCDLKENRKVSTQQGEELAESWNCPFYETSAKMEINHTECFHALVRRCREKPKEKVKEKEVRKGKCLIL